MVVDGILRDTAYKGTFVCYKTHGSRPQCPPRNGPLFPRP